MTAVSWFAYSTLFYHFGVKLPRQPALALSSRLNPSRISHCTLLSVIHCLRYVNRLANTLPTHTHRRTYLHFSQKDAKCVYGAQ